MKRSTLERTASLARAGLATGVRLARRGAGDAAENLVETLGDLRGLAAKVGQMASYVEGMVPADPVAAAAFARLRAHAALSDPAEIRAIVEADLGGPIDALFAAWDDVPLASASLGQVHRAVLPDGTAVAVKVLHPGIREAVESDLAQADRIGRVASIVARGIPVGELVAEIRARLMDELDLQKEAGHQQVYAAAFAGDRDVHVPPVHDRWSSPRILTTTLVTGIELETAASAPAELRARWAVGTWRLFVDGVLRTGLLHGDPHPGNLLFRDDGALWALDFGCVQPLAESDRQRMAELLHTAIVRPDDIEGVLRRLVGAGPFTTTLASVWRGLLAPLSADAVRIDRAHARQVAADVRASKDPRLMLRSAGVSMPPWFVLAHRTFVGLLSVLARLDVGADYVTPTRAALSGSSR